MSKGLIMIKLLSILFLFFQFFFSLTSQACFFKWWKKQQNNKTTTIELRKIEPTEPLTPEAATMPTKREVPLVTMHPFPTSSRQAMDYVVDAFCLHRRSKPQADLFKQDIDLKDLRLARLELRRAHRVWLAESSGSQGVGAPDPQGADPRIANCSEPVLASLAAQTFTLVVVFDLMKRLESEQEEKEARKRRWEDDYDDDDDKPHVLTNPTVWQMDILQSKANETMGELLPLVTKLKKRQNAAVAWCVLTRQATPEEILEKVRLLAQRNATSG